MTPVCTSSRRTAKAFVAFMQARGSLSGEPLEVLEQTVEGGTHAQPARLTFLLTLCTRCEWKPLPRATPSLMRVTGRA